jgi:hypothetical protein
LSSFELLSALYILQRVRSLLLCALPHCEKHQQARSGVTFRDVLRLSGGVRLTEITREPHGWV